MSSAIFSETSNEKTWNNFFKANSLLVSVVAAFFRGEQLADKYIRDCLQNEHYNLLVEGEVLTGEGIEELVQKLSGLTRTSPTLELKKAEMKPFKLLFGRCLRSFAMTKVDVSTGDIELELFVTNPSLKKKGYGTALLTRIKVMLPANALLWANASNCLSKPQFGGYIHFFLVCVLVDCDMFNVIIFCVYYAHFFVLCVCRVLYETWNEVCIVH
jgi:hypothetical protein